MNNDYSVEKLNSIRNEMSHIWGGIFVTGGGAITIVLTMNWNILQITFCLLGLLLSLTFVNAYLTKRIDLVNTLDELKEEK